MKNICIFFIYIIILQSCSTPQSEYFEECDNEKKELEYQVVVDSIENFSIEIPDHFLFKPPFDYFKLFAFDTTGFYADSSMVTITVEYYDLNGKTFDEYYENIEFRTDSSMKVSPDKSRIIKKSNSYITGRASKVNIFELQKWGFKFINSQFYIKEKEQFFVVSVGSTKRDYNDLNCELSRSVESIKKL